jgi:glycerophosphoryl diester phosphodiesterase
LQRPGIIAHRGSSGERAEHTLAAYKLAAAQGATGFECDIQLTADKHVVCIHDSRLDRTSTGTGFVGTKTLAELNELDYRSWHESGHNEFGILTLDSLLSLITFTDLQLFIETKHPSRFGPLLEVKLLELLKRHNLVASTKPESQVFMMSFNALAVQRFAAMAPTVPVVQLLWSATGWMANAALEWADYLGPSKKMLHLDPNLVASTAAAGRGTYVWTTDETTDIEFVAAQGIDYLATNFPDRARKILARL